ncbi:hypothetical protein EYZ11_001705 [Aspergillus tanneri]|uniref:Major facilitator superfamily (MFS) profile domain-containing protein n=1 Tax=Aspergillus tanneri TaxID=1220188 RepID=A0A4S3JTU2_9EURO|nr:uncharacterized protein ATNIH1004_008333 [Aspergillus tanneri]KAA8644135.1 hypothetical protein ATNIH1004_008333 [Aspergillus tanneri]THC98797.1 hypothetical protein EYZ11_001705 [Aspergillus tanneri]
MPSGENYRLRQPNLDLQNGLYPLLTSMKPLTKADDDRDAFLVRFEDGDKENPKNWKPYYKLWLTIEMGMLAFVGSLGSSIMTPASATLSAYLDVSIEATVLVLSLFVLGFALGPLLWAPISEICGRKWSMLPPVLVLGLFSIGTAVSRNATSVFITRFLGGVFGSAPISNVSAALGDIYDPQDRGVPMAFLALCVVGGPTVAPVIGAALTVNPHLGWRWTAYMEAIVAFVVWAVALFFLPETYGPVLLKHKAKRMRESTGDERFWHPSENEKLHPRNAVTKHLHRPLRMFFTEPMLTCIALYASFVYGLLFLSIEVYPIVFYEQRQWSLVVSSIPILGIFVGVLCALFINIANQPLYVRAMVKNGGQPVPEARLPPMIIGGFFFSAGLFWFGWTASPPHCWLSPVVAGGFIGAGFNVVFQQCLNFLVDTYGTYAASAISGNTFLRSLLACGLPLAARPMFLNMGIGPASSLLGGISCLALPVPFIFMKYSSTLRKKSKFATALSG